MRAPDTYAVYPQDPAASAAIVDDPADLGTAFGLDVSLPPDADHTAPAAEEAPLDWLANRRAGAPR